MLWNLEIKTTYDQLANNFPGSVGLVDEEKRMDNTERQCSNMES